MKKFLAVGILALGLIAMSQNQASAWVKWNVGVGLNLGWSSGGNNLLWGAWQNGQVPGQEFYVPQYGHHHHHHGAVEAPYYTPYALDRSYVQPTYVAPSTTPYQTTTNPRPVYYYYSTPYYYGR
jgi:hypothetical protein